MGSVGNHVPAPVPQPSTVAGSGFEADDIAIIGFSLKLPGEATSPEKFWEMLRNGREASGEFPPDRVNLAGHYHPDTSRMDQMPLRGGYFLRDKIDRFDAPFFSISPAEAACMEPQQRGMLETSYRALENAGITISQCSGTRTSVHTGSFTDDYRSVMFHDRLEGHMYAATGLANSILANRVSWFFNLKGPSINLDTACSSSLTALHLACQDLRTGTTDMGLVGGCNLIYHPDYMLMMSNMSFLSTDSRSWSLDEKANGYARGEGFGVLVIKRLSDAARDGDTVRAVIRATRLNQDGRTPGITVPNGEAHKALIRETYAQANIDMEPTRFFEAHATGTQAGDPTEANAVGESFCHVRSASDPLWIGAVKSNVGHLEAGSGMASLFKAILVLEKGIIPPNANFEKLNPRIQAERYHLAIPTEARPWPSRGLRRICVNSFGFGGSNGVVILDDAHHYPRSRGLTVQNRTRVEPPALEDLERTRPNTDDATHVGEHNNGNWTSPNYPSQGILVWSSVDEDGLNRMQSDLSAVFSGQSSEQLTEGDMKDIAYTLCSRRTEFSWRRFVVFSSLSDLQEKLLASSALAKAKSTQGRHAAFVFTGQGAQYAGMGRGLKTVFRTFRESMQYNQKLLDAMGCEWRLEDVMYDMEHTKSDRIHGPQYSQPACTALQIALVDLIWSFGIKPSVVVGHSSGEIAAAYCSGALTRESALRVAFHRGRLAAKLRTTTDCKLSMMAAGLSASETEPYLSKLDKKLSTPGERRVGIACINSPKNVTLSGDVEQLQLLEQLLQGAGIFARRLNVDMAYHSGFMMPIAQEYQDCLHHLQSDGSNSDSTLMVSSVTGDVVYPADLTSPEYWARNMTSPVRFSDAISRLTAQSGKKRKVLGQKATRNTDPLHRKISDMVEIGPHHALRGPVRECLQAAGLVEAIQYHPILTRTSLPSPPTAPGDIMSAAGTLWTLGYPVDLLAVNSLPQDSTRALRTDLPEYSFNHAQVHWRESRVARNYRLRDTPQHDFLGVRSDDWNERQAHWRALVGEARLPWLRDHRLAGEYLYPAGGMIVMAVEAARQLAHPSGGASSFELQDVRFLNAFRALQGASSTVETRFTLSPTVQNPRWSQFHLFIYEETSWVEVCSGRIRAYRDSDDDGYDTNDHLQRWDTLDFEGRLSKTKQSFNTKAFYDVVSAKHDAAYGPSFQTLDNITMSATGEVMVDIKTRKWAETYDDKYVSPHVIHPATVDGLLQLAFPAIYGTTNTVVPTRVGRIWINARALLRRSEQGLSVIRALGECTTRGHRGTDVRARVVAPETGEPLIDMEHYETTIVASNNDAQQGEMEPKKLCATMQWLPDVDVLSAAALKGFVHVEREPDAEAVRIGVYTDLHMIIRFLLSDALERLNGVDVEGMCSKHAQNLVRWMKYQISRAPRKGGADGTAEEKILQDPSFRESKIESVSSYDEECRALTTLARNIYDIVLGHVDPLKILVEGTLAREYYQTTITESPNVLSLTKYLDLLGHKDPGMRILEIGAGTGSSTEVVTKALTQEGRPRWAQYDYTDISPAFFAQARERLDEFSNYMEFRVLDASGDLAKQGFEEASYDLIVAGNVLHTLEDLPRTCINLRKLLKLGGKLVLFETTNPDSIRAGLYGGVTDSWWDSIKDEEKCTPLLSVDSWSETLQDSGFTGLDLVLQDSEDPKLGEQAILVASAAASTDSPQVDRDRAARDTAVATTIVYNGRVAKQKELADLLQNQLGRDARYACNRMDIQSLSPADLSDMSCISLLDVDQPFLARLQEEHFIHLKQIIVSSRDILWVTQDSTVPASPEFSMIDGLARVMRGEYPLLKFVTLSLEAEPELLETPAIIIDTWKRTLQTEHSQTEMEVRQRGGVLEIPRMIHSPSMNSLVAERSKDRHIVENCRLGDAPPLELQIESPGMLDSTCYHEIDGDMVLGPLAEDEVLVRAHAFGFSPRDYLIASGRINEQDMGMQCAGVVEAAGLTSGLQPGNRVCVLRRPAFHTLVRCKVGSVAQIPGSISYEDAASLPAAAVLAVHTLEAMGSLEEYETVLIQNAASTVGQVLVQVAKSMKARVLVTAKGAEQRKMLSEVYSLPDEHIFAKGGTRVLDATDGQGVDVIVALSPSHDETEDFWKCLSGVGRFFHVSDGREINHVESQQGSNASLFRTNLAELVSKRPAYVAKLLRKVATMLQSGTIYPVTGIQTFPAESAKAALEVFAGGDETGSSVVLLTTESLVKTELVNRPLYSFDSNGTYVIAGGLGGIGRSIARWMVARGARHLILLSRSGASRPTAQALVAELTQQNAQVVTPACDIADLDQLKKVIQEASQTMPPFRGCIQGAMNLRDGIFENMSWEDWSESVKPKVLGSWNLHLAMPKGLDFFVLLSSISCILGGVSQANYAVGNAYQNALCRYRHAIGERATSAVNLGMLISEGVVAEDQELLALMRGMGQFMDIEGKEMFALLEHHLAPRRTSHDDSRSQTGSRSLPCADEEGAQPIFGIQLPAAFVAAKRELPYYLTHPHFRHFHYVDTESKKGAHSRNPAELGMDYASAIANDETTDQVAADMVQWLTTKMSRLLGLEMADMDATRPISSYGVDSLMGIELRNWFERELGAKMPVFELLGSSTSMADMCAKAAARTRFRGEKTAH